MSVDEHNRRPDHDADDAEWAVELDRRLAAANARVQVPSGIVSRVEARIRGDQLRRGARRLAIMGAAAATLVAMFGWWQSGLRRTPADPDAGARVVVTEPAEGVLSPVQTPEPRSKDRVHVAFSPESGLFARPIETKSSNVTLMLVYRNLNIARGR